MWGISRNSYAPEATVSSMFSLSFPGFIVSRSFNLVVLKNLNLHFINAIILPVPIYAETASLA